MNKPYDQIFKALGDPHRLKIITLLREREMSAHEILQKVDIEQPVLLHHMKILSDSGVVNAESHGKWMLYSLNEEVMSYSAMFLKECAEGTKESVDDG